MEPLRHAPRPTAVRTTRLVPALLLLAVACGGSDATLRAAGEPLPTSAAPSAPLPSASASADPDAAVPSAPLASFSASASPSPPPATTPPGRDPDQLYEFSGTVLAGREHGPELCVGGIRTSLPPQCGGVPVAPFSWDDVEGEESLNGTTWGEVRLVGTYDGRTFHPTRKPAKPRPLEPGDSDPPFKAACPKPAGGWAVPDRDKTGESHWEAAVGYANGEPDVAALWVVYPSYPPDEYTSPSEQILNVAFTGDLDRHRREIRERWGGALCVVSMPRSRAELSKVQRALTREGAAAGVPIYGSSVDEVGNVVAAMTLIADAVSRRWVDERFGAGWVELDGAFEPVATR